MIPSLFVQNPKTAGLSMRRSNSASRLDANARLKSEIAPLNSSLAADLGGCVNR